MLIVFLDCLPAFLITPMLLAVVAYSTVETIYVSYISFYALVYPDIDPGSVLSDCHPLTSMALQEAFCLLQLGSLSRGQWEL